MNLGEKIRYYSVVIPLGKDCLLKKEKKVEEFSIIGMNAVNIVIDDVDYTTLTYAREYGLTLGKPIVTYSPKDSYFACVRYMCWTQERLSWQDIRVSIAKEISVDVDLEYVYND